MKLLPIVQGSPTDWPIQARLWGGIEAAYAAGDTLSAEVYAYGSQTPLFAPAVAWFTADSTQVGYLQGQMVVSPVAAQSAMLGLLETYSLVVFLTPASAPTKTYPIVRMRLKVESLA